MLGLLQLGIGHHADVKALAQNAHVLQQLAASPRVERGGHTIARLHRLPQLAQAVDHVRPDGVVQRVDTRLLLLLKRLLRARAKLAQGTRLRARQPRLVQRNGGPDARGTRREVSRAGTRRRQRAKGLRERGALEAQCLRAQGSTRRSDTDRAGEEDLAQVRLPARRRRGRGRRWVDVAIFVAAHAGDEDFDRVGARREQQQRADGQVKVIMAHWHALPRMPISSILCQIGLVSTPRVACVCVFSVQTHGYCTTTTR